MTERERPDAEASELEGGGTEQTWGQGEGRHEPTIPDEGGEQDRSRRDLRPDRPMVQPVDPDEASQEMGRSPDATDGQREGQADPNRGLTPKPSGRG